MPEISRFFGIVIAMLLPPVKKYPESAGLIMACVIK